SLFQPAPLGSDMSLQDMSSLRSGDMALLAMSPVARASVAEVAAAGQDHRGACCAHRADDLVVPLRAAGLDQRGDTGREGELRAVGEGEERIRGERGAVQVVAVILCLVDRDPDGV